MQYYTSDYIYNFLGHTWFFKGIVNSFVCTPYQRIIAQLGKPTKGHLQQQSKI